MTGIRRFRRPDRDVQFVRGLIEAVERGDKARAQLREIADGRGDDCEEEWPALYRFSTEHERRSRPVRHVLPVGSE